MRPIAESSNQEAATSVKGTASLPLTVGTAFQLPDFSSDNDFDIDNQPQLGAAASTESSATRSRLQHLAAGDTALVVITSPLHREAKPSDPALNKEVGAHTAQYLRPRLPSAVSSEDSVDDIPYPSPFESAAHPAAGSVAPDKDFESLRDKAMSQMPCITAILQLVAQSPEQYGLLPLSPQQSPTRMHAEGCTAEGRRGELALEFVAAVMLLAARTSQPQPPNGTQSAVTGRSVDTRTGHDAVASAVASMGQLSFERDRPPIPSPTPVAAVPVPRTRIRTSRTAVLLSSPSQAIWAPPCRNLQENQEVLRSSDTPDQFPTHPPTQPSTPVPYTPSAVDSNVSRTSAASRAPDVDSLQQIASGAVYGDTSIRSVLDFILDGDGASPSNGRGHSEEGQGGSVCVRAGVRWAGLAQALLQSYPSLTSAQLRDAVTAATAMLVVPDPSLHPAPLPSGAVLRAAWGVGSQLCRTQGMGWSMAAEGGAELGLADAELGPADGISISGTIPWHSCPHRTLHP